MSFGGWGSRGDSLLGRRSLGRLRFRLVEEAEKVEMAEPSELYSSSSRRRLRSCFDFFFFFLRFFLPKEPAEVRETLDLAEELLDSELSPLKSNSTCSSVLAVGLGRSRRPLPPSLPLVPRRKLTFFLPSVVVGKQGFCPAAFLICFASASSHVYSRGLWEGLWFCSIATK